MSADQSSPPKKSFSSKERGAIESAEEVFVVKGVQSSFLRHRIVIVDVVVHVVLLFVLFCCTCCSVVLYIGSHGAGSVTDGRITADDRCRR